MKSVTIPYRQENHGDFDAEWPIQRGVSGWWYVTGYFSNPADPSRLYSYQFTMVKPNVFGFSPYILQLALTNVQTGQHHFRQRITLRHEDIYVTSDTVNYLSLAQLKREVDRMILVAQTDAFELNLALNKGKGAFWHGDNGVV